MSLGGAAGVMIGEVQDRPRIVRIGFPAPRQIQFQPRMQGRESDKKKGTMGESRESTGDVRASLDVRSSSP